MLRALIDHCVHRRVAALAATVILAVVGLRAFLDTAIEAFPDVTNAQVTVITQMPGYAPEEVERQVTVPLERVLNGTPNMILMRSESLFGLSLITLTFDDQADGFRSRTLVTQRIAGADLPEGIVPHLAPDATPLGEIYQFRLTSDRHNLYELRSELEWGVARILRQVPGVADVISFGGYYKELHVEVYPARLEAHGLTLTDVAEALEHSNLNVGGGFLRHGDQELTVRGIGYLASPEDVKKAVLKSHGGTPVTVGDVARVVLSHAPRRGSVGYNLERDVAEGFVILRRGENPSRVLDGVHAKVAELNASILPKGMHIEAFYDRSDLVGNTLKTVYDNLLHGFVLVVAVVWLFLRTLLGSLIVATVIPLSLLFAFIGLHALGMPANLISMGAIDFGILLDGAVVLVENVIHRLQHHRPRTQKDVRHLIVDAAVEVARPTFFAMMIIIAALIPVFTLERVEGRIFRPLALTYSYALGGALVLALTTVPALCAMLFRPHHAAIREPAILERLRRGYARLLETLLTRRKMALHGRPEDGTDNEGVNMSETFVRLKPTDEWRPGWDKERLIQAMRSSLTEIPGVRFNFSQPIKDNVEESVSGVRGKVVLKIFGPDLEAMRSALEQAKVVLKDVPGVMDLDLYRDASIPQLQVRLNREALARAGVSVEETQGVVETAMAGRELIDWWEGERPVPVRLLLSQVEKDEIARIGALTVPNGAGARIPLRELADLSIAQGRASINREANSRFLALKFNVEGRDMGSVVKDAMSAVTNKVESPDGHFFVWGGEFENQQRAMARSQVIVPVAVLIVLGLLYGALNSGRSAASIMLAAPFALTGGVFALALAEIPLSVSAAIGFIALLGQVSLMGLLVVGAAEQRRRDGEALLPAIIAGAAERLRPVLMASLLALFGLLPMALSTGVGSETQKPFAVVIVGGMVTTLLVALFVLPVFYTYLTPKRLLTPEEQDEL
ncbi:efflux RND transporter permease subunit [Methylocaldum sp.]|uniref:efflux RND transporter permease subunit n=1 Tax=Methylocaldum sp. TaxID=1969727 RepID=UPI002D248944|nr:efflux RND transporter permease subunit [Methylocaldum sp.]HYE35399.1 efflux RND transporter permease subunit [Methylocaldum sp.]